MVELFDVSLGLDLDGLEAGDLGGDGGGHPWGGGEGVGFYLEQPGLLGGGGQGQGEGEGGGLGGGGG